jgi:hypothetical protein
MVFHMMVVSPFKFERMQTCMMIVSVLPNVFYSLSIKINKIYDMLPLSLNIRSFEKNTEIKKVNCGIKFVDN